MLTFKFLFSLQTPLFKNFRPISQLIGVHMFTWLFHRHLKHTVFKIELIIFILPPSSFTVCAFVLPALV